MIPVSEPVLGDRELELVTDCIRSGWISSSGRYLAEFEAGWATYCGRKHGVAVSNGTVALQLAIAALDLKQGDEVILPTFTIISCAMAVAYAGAKPVFVDADPQTWCMDVGQVADRITSRTRAVMPVHIYGHPVDMAPLLTLAERHGIAVVEDAAEAHGAEYQMPDPAPSWRRCGSFGELSTFSFYANKLVTTGEGGMVLTDDDQLADRLRSLRNLAFRPDRRFLHDELGFNFRMTNIQAALGVAQLERMSETVSRKRAIADRYTQNLAAISGLQLPIERPWARSVFWMYGVVLHQSLGRTAANLADQLAKAGVETRPFFLGMHRQPALRDRGLVTADEYPVADRLAAQGLYLPSGAGLTDDQVDFVADAIRMALA